MKFCKPGAKLKAAAGAGVTIVAPIVAAPLRAKPLLGEDVDFRRVGGDARSTTDLACDDADGAR
jgi:hypothetical protein